MVLTQVIDLVRAGEDVRHSRSVREKDFYSLCISEARQRCNQECGREDNHS